MALLASAAKTALRRAASASAAAGQQRPQRRGLSWVKDVTVNVTFVNHEVGLLVVGRTVESACVLASWLLSCGPVLKVHTRPLRARGHQPIHQRPHP